MCKAMSLGFWMLDARFSMPNSFIADIHATQNVAIIWYGGRTGVIAGQAVFVENGTPSGMRSLNLNTALSGDDLFLSWAFTSPGFERTFPLTLQYATLVLDDIDWRNSSGQLVERGVVAAQILSGNWQVTSMGGSAVNFAYAGPDTIQSLSDLAFSVRLFNSFTIPEPSGCAFAGLALSMLWAFRRRVSR